jgi:hypothetical protein
MLRWLRQLCQQSLTGALGCHKIEFDGPSHVVGSKARQAAQAQQAMSAKGMLPRHAEGLLGNRSGVPGRGC